MKKLAILILMLLMFLSNTSYAASKQKAVDNEKEVFYLNLEWWDEFNDPQLHDLLLRVFKNNADLAIAKLKIKEGEQVVKQSIANELPQIGLSGNVERTLHSSDQYFGPDMLIPNFAQTNLLFPISASYELDIWGANHTKTKSIKKQLEIIKEQERADFIAVTANFSASYYNLVKCDKLIKIQKELISLQQEMLNLTQIKFELGKCPVTELISQKQLLKSYQEELNILNKERSIIEQTLVVVIADNDIKKIDNTSDIEIPIVRFPSQIPSDVVEARPDYIMAQKYLEKMGLDVKVAKKNLLPRFVIFGQFGFNAYRLSNLFNSNALLSSIGVAPMLDIFTGGRKLAYLKYKKYEYEEALQNYLKTVLVSYKEVNDSLAIAKTNRDNLISTKERLVLESQNYEIAKTKYETGRGTKLELIRAREDELAMQKDKTGYEANTLISVVGLYKSVGGKNLGQIKEDI